MIDRESNVYYVDVGRPNIKECESQGKERGKRMERESFHVSQILCCFKIGRSEGSMQDKLSFVLVDLKKN